MITDHNMDTYVQGSVTWDPPHQRTYVYPGGDQEVFNDIRKLTVMKTGCHVLEVNHTLQYVVHPGWRYIIQEG